MNEHSVNLVRSYSWNCRNTVVLVIGKNELLANAVTDAKAKADVLSKASGVSLGEIITIDYSWAEIDFVSRPMDKLMLEGCCVRSCEPDETYDIDINPDDIDVTDSVTVVWGIK